MAGTDESTNLRSRFIDKVDDIVFVWYQKWPCILVSSTDKYVVVRRLIDAKINGLGFVNEVLAPDTVLVEMEDAEYIQFVADTVARWGPVRRNLVDGQDLALAEALEEERIQIELLAEELEVLDEMIKRCAEVPLWHAALLRLRRRVMD